MDVSKIGNPDIYVFGFRIQEVTTSLTDFLITAVCLYAFFTLKKRKDLNSAQKFMKYHFLTMGIAAFIGGLFGHMILYLLNDYWRIPGWFASMVSVMFMERAAIDHSRGVLKEKLVDTLMVVNIIEFVVIALITAITINFMWVEIHSVWGIIAVVLPFHIITYTKSKNPGSKLMIIAIGVLVFCIPIFNGPLIIHDFFNHKDLAHIVICIGELTMLKATLAFTKQGEGVKPLAA
jgi:hypothetical protein